MLFVSQAEGVNLQLASDGHVHGDGRLPEQRADRAGRAPSYVRTYVQQPEAERNRGNIMRSRYRRGRYERATLLGLGLRAVDACSPSGKAEARGTSHPGQQGGRRAGRVRRLAICHHSSATGSEVHAAEMARSGRAAAVDGCITH